MSPKQAIWDLLAAIHTAAARLDARNLGPIDASDLHAIERDLQRALRLCRRTMAS